jgi:hypothetical protein
VGLVADETIAQHWKISRVTVAAAFVIAVSSNYLLFYYCSGVSLVLDMNLPCTWD